MPRIERNTVDRTDDLALRFVEMTDALSAPRRIDFVDFLARRDRIVRTFGLADVAINASVRDQQSHRAP